MKKYILFLLFTISLFHQSTYGSKTFWNIVATASGVTTAISLYISLIYWQAAPLKAKSNLSIKDFEERKSAQEKFCQEYINSLKRCFGTTAILALLTAISFYKSVQSTKFIKFKMSHLD